MKWNVVLADDEYFIRQRIKKIIPWDELNLSFAGEAENGQEVLSLLKTTKVDILLLDIKMPKLTGIDVAQYMNHHYPHTKIAILSGYNDFEYARTALRYGVVDYLLKPVNQEDLVKTLQTCIDQLEQEQERDTHFEQLKKYERTMDLGKVLNGTIEFAQLAVNYPEFSAFSHSAFISAYFHENGSQLLATLSSRLNKNEVFHVTYQESDKVYIIQVFWPETAADTRLAELLQRFLHGTNDTFLYLGRSFPITADWKLYHKGISARTMRRYFYSLPALLTEGPAEQHDTAELNFHTIRETVTMHLNNQSEQGFKDYIHELFQTVRENRSVRTLTLTVSELFLTYALYSSQNQISSELAEDLGRSMLEEEATIDTLEQSVVSYGLSCLSHEKAQPSEVSTSKKIISYIEEHYQESDLSVSQIAEILSLNVSYMGSLFKKVNNQSVLQYLTALRMKQAKLLLEQGDLRVFEVAEQVGYTDVFYFSRRFKKSYGCSPKDYAARF